MPTARLTGTQVSHISTGGFFWSSAYSAADLAEDFFYWFDKNSGEMFKASLPGLGGQTTIATVSNISSMKAMVAHPTDSSKMVFFNSTDGVGTIDTTSGAVVILQDVATFNALLAGTALELANLSYAKIRGTSVMINGESENTGAVWLYDPTAGTANLLIKSNGFQRVVEKGPDATNELLLSGYQEPDRMFYTRNITTDEVAVVAGVGDNDFVDGEALSVAKFTTMENLWRMASDLYYLRGGSNKVRWIQEGEVGSYAAGELGGDHFCCLLPGRNMAVSVEVQGVTVWS